MITKLNINLFGHFYTGNPPFKNISQFFAIETVVLQSKSFNFLTIFVNTAVYCSNTKIFYY